MTDPTERPAHQLARAIAAREISPVAVVEAHLTRIARLDPTLRAFVEVYGDDARLAAEGADRMIRAGHAVGGVPVALKDLIDLEGRISTAGIVPLSTSLDTPGPMARSVEDVALLYTLLSGPDPPRSEHPGHPS